MKLYPTYIVLEKANGQHYKLFSTTEWTAAENKLANLKKTCPEGIFEIHGQYEHQKYPQLKLIEPKQTFQQSDLRFEAEERMSAMA